MSGSTPAWVLESEPREASILRRTKLITGACLLILSMAVARCASVPESPPSVMDLRLPGLPWGISSPEVTAALVERGFRFAGRNAMGDLRFAEGELLGHDASLVARMYEDRLVKIVAFLEPGSSGRATREIESIVRTLSRFYGSPSIIDPRIRGAASESVPDSSNPRTIRCAWVHPLPDGRTFGVLFRTTPRPGYRLDLESPLWPYVYADREDANLEDALAMPSLET